MRGFSGKLFVLLAVSAVLSAGILAGMLRPMEAMPRMVDLGNELPAELPGWTMRDLPLGDTETIIEATKNILRFDSFVHRKFRRGEYLVTVYGAFWSAGTMPSQSVASHSPDHCWVLAGWKCNDWQSRAAPARASQLLGPVEVRSFVAPSGQTMNVWYWHLQNGVSADYGFRGNIMNYTSRWLRDSMRQVFSSSPEQFFIRLSSQQPLEDFAGDPGGMILFDMILWQESLLRRIPCRKDDVPSVARRLDRGALEIVSVNVAPEGVMSAFGSPV
jgi:hypothetical protein